jgi:hypothetical protein
MFIRTREAQKAVEGKQSREFTGNIPRRTIAISGPCHSYALKVMAIAAGQRAQGACRTPVKAVKMPTVPKRLIRRKGQSAEKE